MKWELTHFKPENLECKCGCGLMNMKETFMWKVEFARTEAQMAFIVSSGCRCKEWNKHEGGTETSDHLTGEGIDVKVVGSHQRLKVVSAAIVSGIKRIGVAKTFIHLGDNIRQNPVGLWSY